ncbi:NADP-dependent oxidoreductase domain-containing protein [Entophlyctis helioformis]|nr:NADP-dependent oxidoreductase domain-containing protein [Entophlyctis helioformis]
MSLGRTFTLRTGAVTPAVGLGTWRSSKPTEATTAVSHAIRAGYRHIDCALCYENEHEVGQGIIDGGVPREQLFITSKLWNTFHRPEHVPTGIAQTLKDLGTDYLDLYLMHWPVAHVNRGDGNSERDASGKPLVDTEVTIEQTWRAMEKLVDEGKTRAIGVSNFNIRNLKELLAYARIKPAVNQVELHPYLPQNELLEFCKANDILVTAYSPLGSTPGPGSVLNDTTIAEIATRLGKTPAQVLISWAVQRGTQRITSNFQDFVLPDADFQAINGLAAARGKTTRYIEPKGFWGVTVFDD